MKILVPCPECALNAKEGDSVEENGVEFRDDRILYVDCKYGHKTGVFLKHDKFELLFDSGALAIATGFSREAVANFAASLERFFEFYIRVICSARGLSEKVIAAAWKPISKQSERQFGAFLFTYLLHNEGTWESYNQSLSEFRNKVIHQGYFPTREEAVDYGRYVYCILTSEIQRLKKEHVQAIDQIFTNLESAAQQTIQNASNKSENGQRAVHSAMIQPLVCTRTIRPDVKVLEFDFALERFQKRHIWR